MGCCCAKAAPAKAAGSGGRDYFLCLRDVIGRRPDDSVTPEIEIANFNGYPGFDKDTGLAFYGLLMSLQGQNPGGASLAGALAFADSHSELSETYDLTGTETACLQLSMGTLHGVMSQCFRERQFGSGLNATFYAIYSAYVKIAQHGREGATQFHGVRKVSEGSLPSSKGGRQVLFDTQEWSQDIKQYEQGMINCHYGKLPGWPEDDFLGCEEDEKIYEHDFGDYVFLHLDAKTADAGSFYSPLDLSRFWGNSGKHITPPLTAFVVTDVWEEHVELQDNFRVWHRGVQKHLRVECAFSLQLLSGVTRPKEEIWDAVRDGNLPDLEAWLHKYPTMDLEYEHLEHRCSLLYSACRYGHTECVKTLVQNCAMINSQISASSSTPLHAAVFFDHSDLVEFLLDNFADPGIKNNLGLSPMEEAKPNTKALIQSLLVSSSAAATQPTEGLKLAADARELRYGSRAGFILGLRSIIGEPSRTMEQEFTHQPDFSWTADGRSTTAKQAWDACMRHVQQNNLMDHPMKDHADLTFDEIVGCALYTGPAYVPLNNWLRELGPAVEGDNVKEIKRLRGPAFSWTSTVMNIVSGMQKMVESAGKSEKRCDPWDGEIRTIEDMWSFYIPQWYLDQVTEYWRDYCTVVDHCDVVDLKRGIKGMLPQTFFVPDERGMVTLTEYAFMSTTSDPSKADHFSGQGIKVIMSITPTPEDAFGYHNGADLDWLSIYKGEKEVLFPPGTIFDVVGRKREGKRVDIKARATFLF